MESLLYRCWRSWLVLRLGPDFSQLQSRSVQLLFYLPERCCSLGVETHTHVRSLKGIVDLAFQRLVFYLRA